MKRNIAVSLIAVAVWYCAVLTTLRAQRVEPAPQALNEVGIDEKLDTQIPLDLTFQNEKGRTIELAEIFRGDRPVILALTYSDCPMLCHLQLDGFVEALREMTFAPGEDFDVVNVSIDPNETTQRALLTKKKHVLGYGRPETADGWHFLVGEDANIRTLADAVGFRYKFVRERKEYAHAAALIICTPDGRVSRYLYGVQFPPQTVRLSLVEAADGKVGSTLDQVLLFCFHYDAASGKYGPAAFRLMQLGGLTTLTVLMIGLLPYWIRRNRGKSPETSLKPEGAVS